MSDIFCACEGRRFPENEFEDQNGVKIHKKGKERHYLNGRGDPDITVVPVNPPLIKELTELASTLDEAGLKNLIEQAKKLTSKTAK